MATVIETLRGIFRPQTFVIEAEGPRDITAREALLDRAMAPGRKRKSSEAIRRGRLAAEGLSLVARGEDGELVGTVRLWHVQAGISQSGHPVDALLLGPLAVCPSHEGKGIGSALMRAAIAEAARRGHGAILLVGDAAYYQRFGFSADLTRTLVMPGPYEKSRFVGLELVGGWLDGAAGIVVPTGKRLGPDADGQATDRAA